MAKRIVVVAMLRKRRDTARQARPLAVKYINDHGRRQSDHGEPSPLPFRLNPGSVAAPDA
jgi:hypothetical protein